MNVRKYAFDCLVNIYMNKSYSNIDLDHMIRENDINDLDKGLLTQIVYGTMQHDYLLRWEIEQQSKKTPRKKQEILLMMSLYQLRYLDRVPAYAIINEAVEIAKEIDGEFGAKFINAMLRTFTREKLTPKLEDFKDEYEYNSLIYNHPIWLMKMWEKYYGKDVTMKILKANGQLAPLTFRVNTLKTTKEELLKTNLFEEGKLAQNSLIYIGEESFLTTDAFKNNLISVQDESSQFVTEQLLVNENDIILDMCAAPGSKTMHMAEILNNRGKILAIDLHEHRVELLKSALKRANITNVVVKCDDSSTLSSKVRHNYFTKILLDAPCSGLGVIRRKADILHDMNSDKIAGIISIQEKLLEEAYKLLKVGGEIVYSTCTLNKKENDLQIIAFLNRHKDMKKVYEKTIFPFEYNSDGFYIAKLKKEG